MKKTFIGLCFGLMVVILIVFGFSTSGFNKKITRIDFPVIGGLLPHDEVVGASVSCTAK